MSEPRGKGWDFAACGLLLVAPLAGHMAHHGFDFLSADSAALLVPALGAGLLYGWMAHRAPRVVRIFLLGALTAAFLDLALSLESGISFWIPLGGAFAAAWVFHEHYTKIVTVAVAAMTLGLPLRPSLQVREWTAPARVPPRSSALIPIVHIVLDEHAAPKAFPTDLTEAVRARDRMLEFYRQHRFRVYWNAFSRFHWSRTAIPAMMAPSAPEGTPPVLELGERHYLVTQNQVFERAAAAGYRIHVVQNNYLDFCNRARPIVTSCRTYPVNSLESLRLLRLPIHRRVYLEYAYYLLVESYVLNRLRGNRSRSELERIREDNPGTAVWAADRAGAGMALRALADLRVRLAADLQGSYTFVHVLFPHSPYEVDRWCRGISAPRQRLTTALPWSRRNTKASRRFRWALYSSQVQCLYRELDRILAVIDSVAPPQGVLVILHGDHGSRIARTDPDPAHRDRLSDENLLDSFSTLLAVRGPAVPPGVDWAPVPIQTFIPALAGGMPIVALPAGEQEPGVYLESWEFGAERPVLIRSKALAH